MPERDDVTGGDLSARERLDAAEEAGDEERLETLEQVHRELEEELAKPDRPGADEPAGPA